MQVLILFWPDHGDLSPFNIFRHHAPSASSKGCERATDELEERQGMSSESSSEEDICDALKAV
jgi:hypothetical protein